MMPTNGKSAGVETMKAASGLPHSTTLARNSGVPLRPRGRGRLLYAALIFVRWWADGKSCLYVSVGQLPITNY